MRFTVAITASLVAAGFLADAASAACPDETSPMSQIDRTSYERSLFCLINEARIGGGLVPLRPNIRLERVAQTYSAAMVEGRFFSHRSPNGTNTISRIRATGYFRGRGGWSVGENLVWATASVSTPRALVQSWLSSPPHREHLMGPGYRELGVGAVRGTPFPAPSESVALPTLPVPLPTLPVGVQPPQEQGVTAVTEFGVRTPPRPSRSKR